ncbi:MAG: DUF4364 family protein [Ruminococcus sp.]|nr:DUF4364 family protein [Ruminococcus sp.]
MAFDTFDEGIIPGGLRSKNEIKVLICYLFHTVNDSLSKNIVVAAIQNESLANYFETLSAFDDLVQNENLRECENCSKDKTYILTENGKMIANQLETTLSYTVKDKAYVCATKLLSQKQTEKNNSAEILKTEVGYDIECKISGGDIELLKFTIYAPTLEQAILIRKNFYKNPTLIYNTVLSLVTNDKASVNDALEQLNKRL